ncbi:MAG: hypothetical protein V3U78_09940 [Thiotrichaceae bacterium]
MLPLLIGAFLRNKAKADKSDIMIDVDKKMDEKIAPINKRMDKHDEDFKDFKHNEFDPMKQDIQELITKTSVLKTQTDTIITGQENLMKFIIKMSDKLDTKKDK